MAEPAHEHKNLKLRGHINLDPSWAHKIRSLMGTYWSLQWLYMKASLWQVIQPRDHRPIMSQMPVGGQLAAVNDATALRQWHGALLKTVCHAALAVDYAKIAPSFALPKQHHVHVSNDLKVVLSFVLSEHDAQVPNDIKVVLLFALSKAISRSSFAALHGSSPCCMQSSC